MTTLGAKFLFYLAIIVLIGLIYLAIRIAQRPLRRSWHRSLLWVGIPLGVIIFLKFIYIVDRYSKRSFTIGQLERKSPIIPIAIIGGGPAGLSAAMYGSRAGFHTVVFQGYEAGGQLMGTSFIENWPGVPRQEGPKVMQNVEQQAAGFGVMLLPQQVKKINCASWPFEIETSKGEKVYALTAIIATGAFPRKLGIPGEQHYWGSGHGVVGCPKCDAPFTKGKQTIVIGGGDTALEYAFQLAPYATKVTIFVRKGELRATPHMQKKLVDYPNVALAHHKQVVEIKGNGERVTSVTLKDSKDGSLSDFPTDWVFYAVGFEPDTALIKGQLALDNSGSVRVSCRSQHTSVPGIFAAGNVSDPTYRQAVTGAGDGAKAGLDAVQFLFDLDNTLIEYCSTRGLPTDCIKTGKLN